jgi:hypothetical protein
MLNHELKITPSAQQAMPCGKELFYKSMRKVITAAGRIPQGDGKSF